MRAQLLIAAPVKRSSFTAAGPSSLTKSQLPAPLQLLDRRPPRRVISTCVKAFAFTFPTFPTNFSHIFHGKIVEILEFCQKLVENLLKTRLPIFRRFVQKIHISAGNFVHFATGPRAVKVDPFTHICNHSVTLQARKFLL